MRQRSIFSTIISHSWWLDGVTVSRLRHSIRAAGREQAGRRWRQSGCREEPKLPAIMNQSKWCLSCSILLCFLSSFILLKEKSELCQTALWWRFRGSGRERKKNATEGCGRSGRNAAVKTLDARMIVRYTDDPLYTLISLSIVWQILLHFYFISNVLQLFNWSY